MHRSAGETEGIGSWETVRGLAATSLVLVLGVGVPRLGWDTGRSRSFTPPTRPMGRDSGMPFLVRLPPPGISPWAVGSWFRRWSGNRVKRTLHFQGLGYPAGATAATAPVHQRCPSGATVRGARLDSRRRSVAGGRSESYARSYASGPGSRDGTLQVSRAGNAEKSQTTPFSIRPRQTRRQGHCGPISPRRPDHLPQGSYDDAGMVLQ